MGRMDREDGRVWRAIELLMMKFVGIAATRRHDTARNSVSVSVSACRAQQSTEEPAKLTEQQTKRKERNSYYNRNKQKNKVHNCGSSDGLHVAQNRELISFLLRLSKSFSHSIDLPPQLHPGKPSHTFHVTHRL